MRTELVETTVKVEATDEQLMGAYQRGDAAAFRELVGRHRMAVFQFLIRYTGNHAHAEDVLQETWLRVVRSSADYRPTARFTTWLYTLARNLCMDKARRDKLRAADSLDRPLHASSGDDGASLGESMSDGGEAAPDRRAHSNRVRPLLQRMIGELPEEQREVFVLREFSGLSFGEIAVVTRVNENTVKSRMRYALDTLRKRLRAANIDGEWEEATAAAGS